MSSTNQKMFHILVSAHWKEDTRTIQRQNKKKIVMPPFMAVSVYMDVMSVFDMSDFTPMYRNQTSHTLLKRKNSTTINSCMHECFFYRIQRV